MTAMLALSLLIGPGHYGLVDGRAPTYQLAYTGDTRQTFVATIHQLAPAQGCELFSLQQQRGRKRFLGASPLGLFEFYPADMEGLRPDTQSAPTLLLKADPKVGDTWHWVEPFRGQISVGPGDSAPDMSELASDCKATVVAVDERVTTPAGTFKAIHVVTVRTSKRQGETKTDLWVAPNVGIVRETTGNETWKSELVLVKA